MFIVEHHLPLQPAYTLGWVYAMGTGLETCIYVLVGGKVETTSDSSASTIYTIVYILFKGETLLFT